MVITFSLEQKYICSIFEHNMSRSAVNYKYINKYGASNEATSRHSWSSSSYYVTCVRVSVCVRVRCVGCSAWHQYNKSNSLSCHTFRMTIKVAVKLHALHCHCSYLNNGTNNNQARAGAAARLTDCPAWHPISIAGRKLSM